MKRIPSGGMQIHMAYSVLVYTVRLHVAGRDALSKLFNKLLPLALAARTRRDNGPAKTHSSIFAIPFRHLSSYTICCSIVLATVVVVVVLIVVAVIVVGVSSTARSLCAIIQLIPGNIIYETLCMFIAGNNHSFPAPSTCSPYIHTYSSMCVCVCECSCI